MPMKHPIPHSVYLHILSPIHVGTGQDLDPFSYVIRADTLFLIDLVRWMESYPDPAKLHAMMDNDNYAVIRSFVAENFNDPDAVLYRVPVDDPGLSETYRSAIAKKDPKNQVLISPMTRNPLTMAPYIPGSSIKGAVRTAIGNQFVAAARVTKNDVRGRDDYNAKIFGRIQDDPMRHLKISDAHLGPEGSVIVEAREFSLNAEKNPTPKGSLEAAVSFCHTGKPVKVPFQLSMAPFSLKGKTVDPAFVLDALNRFYIDKYVAEYSKFFRGQRAERIRAALAPVNAAAAQLKTNEALIRIGHFSHVECITLDEVRNPMTRRGKDGRPLPWGVTRTLANGLYPFGWAKIEFVDMAAEPRPERKWPFDVTAGAGAAAAKTLTPAALQAMATGPAGPAPDEAAARPFKPVSSGQPPAERLSPLEVLLKDLSVIEENKMGELGSIVQKMKTLEDDADKGALAKAVLRKMSGKKLKKYKNRAYLEELVRKAGL